MVHHDLWDYDGASPVVLFDAEIDGEERLGLAAPGKTGWVYILDRVTGEPLLGIEERPVPQEPRQATSPTQPYPIGDAFVPQHLDVAPEGMPLVNGGRIFTPHWDEPHAVKPGTLGGANWPPPSYDPETQMLYVCASDLASYKIVDQAVDETPRPGVGRNGGVSRYVPGPPPLGVFAAVDLRTNRVVWDQHWSDTCYSGSVATGGGLVFVGRNDGRFTALDSADGSLLWAFQTGAGVNAPASVFQYQDRQYVVVFSAGNLYARSARGDSVWLFSLEGTLDAVEVPSMSNAANAGTVADVARSADVVSGRQVCVYCHGELGEGGHSGMPLTKATDTKDIRRVVIDGRNQMPAFGLILSPAQVQDVTAYVVGELPH